MYPRTPPQLPLLHQDGDPKTAGMVADILIASCAVVGRVHRRASFPVVSNGPHVQTFTNGNRPRTSPETLQGSERPQTSKTRGSSRSASSRGGSRRPRSVGSGSGFLEEKNVAFQGTRRNDIWVREGDGTKPDAKQVSIPVLVPVSVPVVSRTIATVYENLFDFGPRVGDGGFGTGDGGTSSLGGGGGGGANAWDFAEVIMYKQMASKTAELKKVALASYPDPVEEEVATGKEEVDEIEEVLAEQELPEEVTGTLSENELLSLASLQPDLSSGAIDDAEQFADYDLDENRDLQRESNEEERREPPLLDSFPSEKQLTTSQEIIQRSPDPILSPKNTEHLISTPSLERESHLLNFSHSTITDPVRLGSAGDGSSQLGSSESIVVKEEKEADYEVSTPGKAASTEQLEIFPSLTPPKSGGSRSEIDAGYEEYEAELQRQDRALQLQAEESRKREMEEAHKKARAQSAVRRNLLIFEKIKDTGKSTTDGRVDEFVYSITESDISLTHAERNMVRLQSTMNVNGLLQATHNRQVAGLRQERIMSAREVVCVAHIEEQLGRLAARETRRRQLRAFQAYGRWPGEMPIDLYVQPHDGYHDYGNSGHIQKCGERERPTTTQATVYPTVKVQNRQRRGLPPLSTKIISPAPKLLQRPRTTSCMR